MTRPELTDRCNRTIRAVNSPHCCNWGDLAAAPWTDQRLVVVGVPALRLIGLADSFHAVHFIRSLEISSRAARDSSTLVRSFAIACRAWIRSALLSASSAQ